MHSGLEVRNRVRVMISLISSCFSHVVWLHSKWGCMGTSCCMCMTFRSLVEIEFHLVLALCVLSSYEHFLNGVYMILPFIRAFLYHELLKNAILKKFPKITVHYNILWNLTNWFFSLKMFFVVRTYEYKYYNEYKMSFCY